MTKELSLNKELLGTGAVSEVEVLRLERQASDLSGELNRTKLLIPRLEEKIKEHKNRIKGTYADFQTKAINALNESEAEFASVSQINIARRDRVARTIVRSPVNGIVNLVYIKTIGGVIKPGMNLVEIVPAEDSLLVKAKIIPSQVAFLHPQQNAMVRFTAYDFSIYGGLKGKLIHISPDTIADDKGNSYYEIRIRTHKSYLGPESDPLPIIPGMTAEVDIITNKRSILNYILKPITRAQQRALREN